MLLIKNKNVVMTKELITINTLNAAPLFQFTTIHKKILFLYFIRSAIKTILIRKENEFVK
jgi:hypothetical protein